MIIAAIDPGVKNFAIAVEYVDTATFHPLVHAKDIDTALLCSETVYTNVRDIACDNPVKAVTCLLKDYTWIWEMCDVVVIERQMQFGGVVNNTCLRIAHHCMSFLELFYPSVDVLEYQSSNKTRVLNAPKGMSKPQRKKWAVDTVTGILNNRGDTRTLQLLGDIKSSGQKLDDICDCILMCLTHCILLGKKTRRSFIS
jgi:hypothetical protein